MSGLQKNAVDFETVHDFLNERFLMKIFGAYNVLKEPRLYFLVNLTYILCVILLYTYLVLTGLYTLTLPVGDGTFKVQVFQVLCIMLVGMAYPSIRFYHRANINAALNYMKCGFDQYDMNDLNGDYVEIRKKRVKQVRFWSFVFGIMCYSDALSVTLKPPISYFMRTGQEEEEVDDGVNVYLPLPVYVPFNTRSPSGYAIAFMTNLIYIIVMHTSLFCLIESYLSCALQLLAQVEILNYSLENIENRVFLKLHSDNKLAGHGRTTIGSNDILEYQKNLNSCLKRNIKHHQAIVRCSTEIKEYLGAVNTFSIFIFALVFASSIVPIIQDPIRNSSLSSHLVTEMTGYFQLFFVGQIVTDRSADTMKSLYSTPWIKSNKNYSSMLNIMITNAKKPILFRTPFFNADWTLETFGMMLSGAYKLVNILLNTV